MKAPKFQIIPRKITDRQVAECLRGLKAAQCFRHLLDAAREQIDYAQGYAHGLGEAEAVLQAWERGTQHPFFRIWQERQATQKRPGPTATELEARRMVMLMCVALERVGFSKVQRKLHKFAAGALRGTSLFARPPTHRTIEHWAEEPLRLNPLDEQLLAACIAVCGRGAADKIALFFISLAHLVHDPAATVLIEAPGLPPL